MSISGARRAQTSPGLPADAHDAGFWGAKMGMGGTTARWCTNAALKYCCKRQHIVKHWSHGKSHQETLVFALRYPSTMQLCHLATVQARLLSFGPIQRYGSCGVSVKCEEQTLAVHNQGCLCCQRHTPHSACMQVLTTTQYNWSLQ